MEEPLGRQLALAAKVVQARIDALMAERGAGLTSWIVLNRLDGQPSQRELASQMRIEAPTLVRHLDRMERDGLLERHRDERDRRVVRVSVTPAGRRLHTELERVAERFDTELRSLLSATEERTLARALRRIREHYSQAALREARIDGERVR